MFDLSMAEIGVIGIVALLVLGPERLPKAARTLGFYVRKARQSWYSVRAEFERELAVEELKRSLKLDEVHATLKDTAKELQTDLSSANAALAEARAEADSVLARASGADPLPGSLMAQAESAASGDLADFGGLSPEEQARQSEALPAPSGPDSDGLQDAVGDVVDPVAEVPTGGSSTVGAQAVPSQRNESPAANA